MEESSTQKGGTELKRIALAVLTVALVLSLLVGCAGPATPTATPSPTATSASPTPTPTPTSGGVTVGVWEQLSSFGGEVFWCLAIDPGNPQTLYAGIVGDGICKSTNGGAGWTASSSGLPNSPYSYVFSLAIDPSGTLYAVTANGVFRMAPEQ